MSTASTTRQTTAAGDSTGSLATPVAEQVELEDLENGTRKTVEVEVTMTTTGRQGQLAIPRPPGSYFPERRHRNWCP